MLDWWELIIKQYGCWPRLQLIWMLQMFLQVAQRCWWHSFQNCHRFSQPSICTNTVKLLSPRIPIKQPVRSRILILSNHLLLWCLSEISCIWRFSTLFRLFCVELKHRSFWSALPMMITLFLYHSFLCAVSSSNLTSISLESLFHLFDRSVSFHSCFDVKQYYIIQLTPESKNIDVVGMPFDVGIEFSWSSDHVVKRGVIL